MKTELNEPVGGSESASTLMRQMRLPTEGKFSSYAPADHTNNSYISGLHSEIETDSEIG